MNTQPPLPDGLTAIAIGDQGLRGWRVETPACRALICQQGAQLLEFQSRGEPPLLWLSPRATRQPGKAIRGGIPLCFPWFGPHPADPARPAHGFARQRDWTLARAGQAPDMSGLELEFTLAADAATRELWPHEFLATLRMRLGHQLALQLAVTNTGSSPFSFSFAFHSYFPLADSSRARVEGLGGSTCIDQLSAGRQRSRQTGPVRFSGETDRIFLGTPGDCRLVDEATGYAIHVTTTGCRSVVAWNPGAEKAARLADMPADAWRGMACVEAGNVGEDATVLQAGKTGTYSMVLAQQSTAAPER